MDTKMRSRKYELDWLRVSAILLVFLYHSTRFFNLGDWHVKNIHTYAWLEMWSVFAMSWLMPLFFIISGASLFYAIEKSGSWRKFYTDKFLRLMVPVLVGSVTHCALIVYLERITHGRFSGSFFSFLPEYFNGLYLGIGAPGNFVFHGAHLWYLLFLFCQCMICYRLFVWFKGNGKSFLDRIARVFAMPGLIYLWFSIPLLLLKVFIPQEVLGAGAGSWGFLYYLWFLVAGFMIISSSRLQQTIKNQRWISLLLAVILSTIALVRQFNPSFFVFAEWIGPWVDTAVYFLSAWCWLLAILGFGMRYLAFDHPVLRYTNEGVLPFFILHQTVLLVFGYFIMTWQIPDFLKWVTVFISSFVVIMILYLFLIRKMDLLRFLFGMKTTLPAFEIFRKRPALIIMPALYVGLIIMAINVGTYRHSPMPLRYDPGQDILLNADAISARSSTGVRVVGDEGASIGRAIEFLSGANKCVEAHPAVYIEMSFSAPAGRYVVWLRGKCNIDDGWTDSVWLQTDDQIGAPIRSVRLGNWLDIHPAAAYAWASDSNHPMAVELKYSGNHRIRIQPRQTPHRIDQIWMSRTQNRIPDTRRYIQ